MYSSIHPYMYVYICVYINRVSEIFRSELLVLGKNGVLQRVAVCCSASQGAADARCLKQSEVSRLWLHCSEAMPRHHGSPPSPLHTHHPTPTPTNKHTNTNMSTRERRSMRARQLHSKFGSARKALCRAGRG